MNVVFGGARGGACMRGLATPQTPRAGRGSGSGFHGGRRSTPTLRVGLPPPMVPSQNQPSSPTWARKGSMEQSVHRPLIKSGLWLHRRVNSAAGERVGLDPLRRPRRPVVTACYIDPPTRIGRTSFALRLRLRRRSQLAAQPLACANTPEPSVATASQAC